MVVDATNKGLNHKIVNWLKRQSNEKVSEIITLND
jgi:hypothetical protein